MSEDDVHHQQEPVYFWENQPCSWAPSQSNSDNPAGSGSGSGSGQAKEISAAMLMKPPKTPSFNHQKDENNKGDAAEADPDKKKSRGTGATRSDNKNKNKKRANGKATKKSEHDIHIWTERERRKKMRNMFTTLHSLLPQLPPKADKSTIVDEAVSQIKNLEHTLQTLQQKKLERLQSVSNAKYGYEQPSGLTSNTQWHPSNSREAFIADQGSSNNFGIAASNPSPSVSVPQLPVSFQTFSSDNVVLNICGNQAQFCVYAPKKPGMFTKIGFVLEKYKIEVLSAHMSSDANRSMFMIQAQANGASNEFPAAELFITEEIFRQAATEIGMWISQN
ncbi:hypothetical protein L6164_035683 [Bauhinia variegata]|uniref:Uncharacterized protein n=1 Tax=Bauhinia variegata TaxID=167791 RepID=A0ACB9KES1_BAUVA|nr:hypothetical protein L6164_035683 [Bauhinia variegata]